MLRPRSSCSSEGTRLLQARKTVRLPLVGNRASRRPRAAKRHLDLRTRCSPRAPRARSPSRPFANPNCRTVKGKTGKQRKGCQTERKDCQTKDTTQSKDCQRDRQRTALEITQSSRPKTRTPTTSDLQLDLWVVEDLRLSRLSPAQLQLPLRSGGRGLSEALAVGLDTSPHTGAVLIPCDL